MRSPAVRRSAPLKNSRPFNGIFLLKTPFHTSLMMAHCATFLTVGRTSMKRKERRELGRARWTCSRPATTFHRKMEQHSGQFQKSRKFGGVSIGMGSDGHRSSVGASERGIWLLVGWGHCVNCRQFRSHWKIEREG